MGPVREISKAYFSGLFAIFAPICPFAAELGSNIGAAWERAGPPAAAVTPQRETAQPFGANRKSPSQNW
jgi:hypothetical protein